MVYAFKHSRNLLFAAVVFGSFSASLFAQEDPPSRVARLNYINGNVSMQPAGVDEWAPAVINRPFAIGDYLYTDRSSVAELHLDNAVLRMGQVTSFGFLNLTDQLAQLKLTEGDMSFSLHDLGPNDVFEVDTPNAAITLLRSGVYRIHVDPDANTTFVSTRSGEAEVTGGGQAFTLNPGNSASLSGTDQLAYDIEGPPQPDSFDNWCSQRDAREARSESRRYLPPTVVGSEDMGDYGAWAEEPEYGAVWYPRSVPSGWAPYHDGHWAWIEPWGWTWVDDAPWGFAPFHYGRWVYGHDRWGWAPGPCARVGYGGPVIRPVYAPALVAWFGGAHWGVSIGIGGGGPSVGWVPLGWGEVYTPSYHCSRPYFNNVNINNTHIVNNTNITNVYNTVYVNKTVYNQTFVNVKAPNAVNAMQQNAFASGRPVGQAGGTLTRAQLARFQPSQAAMVAPPVAPTRQAVASSLGRPAVTPPPQVTQRQVIARSTPAPAPASFAARQGFLQQHAGQPHDSIAMRQAVAPPAHPVAAVHQVTNAQPVVVHPGEHHGNAPPPVAAQHEIAPQHGVAPQPAQVGHSAPGTPAARGNAPAQNAPPLTPQGHGVPPGQRPVSQTAAPNQTERGVQPGPNRPTAPTLATPPVREPAPAQTAPSPAHPSHGTPPNLRPAPQPQQPAARQNEREVQPSPTQARPPSYSQPTRQVSPEERQPQPTRSPEPARTPPPAAHQNDRQVQPGPTQARPPSYSQPNRQAYPEERQPQPARSPEPARTPPPPPRPAEQPRAQEPRPPTERPPAARPEPSHEQQHGNPPNREQKQDSKTDHKEK